MSSIENGKSTAPRADRNSMRVRTNSDGDRTRHADHNVVFRDSFKLGDEVFPAGHYAVETSEQRYEGNTLTARVRTCTVLIVPTPTGTRAVQINPGDLETALKADAERDNLNSQSANPDRGRAGTSKGESVRAESEQSELDRYAIERVPADAFLWQGYRYTNASDAIAAAKRSVKG